MKKRSKRLQEAKKKIEKDNFSIEEAVKLVKEISTEKFDASIDAHVRLGIDIAKSDQHVKGAAHLPHGSGKKVRVAVFVSSDMEKEVKEAGADIVGGVELIEQIKTTKKADFDVAIATPDMMKNLSQVARILGPKGLMPNPKVGTVTPDPVKAIKDLAGGKVNFKNDPAGIIHQAIGKKSFTDEQLIENFNALVDSIKKLKPAKIKGEFIKNITVCSSMGPGVRVK